MPEIVPTRRSVLRTAAWAVPAVTVATAAPAFAASQVVPGPNLSTSRANATPPSRTNNKVTIPPTTLVNTGDVDGVGVVIRYESDGPNITAIDFDLGIFTVPAASAADGGVTGMGTQVVELRINNPLSGAVLIPAGSSTGWTSPATQILTLSAAVPFNLKVTATAGNGGTPYAPPIQSL